MTRRGSAAGKGNLAHQRMPGEGSARGRTITGDDVDDARRNPRFQRQTGQLQYRGGGMFGGFEHDGVARCQRRSELDGGQVKRAVPRDDASHYAHRFMHGVDEQVWLVEGQGATFELVGQPCGVMKELGQIADLTTGFTDQFAVVAAFQLRQLFLVLGNQIAQPAQQFAACGRGQTTPSRVLESFLCGLHGALHVRFVSVGQLRPGLRQCRVEAVEGLA